MQGFSLRFPFLYVCKRKIQRTSTWPTKKNEEGNSFLNFFQALLHVSYRWLYPFKPRYQGILKDARWNRNDTDEGIHQC